MTSQDLIGETHTAACVDDGELNKIYILRVKEKPGLAKIGDTFRDVETRNQETITNSSLHRVG
jgi:hypothetical protein